MRTPNPSCRPRAAFVISTFLLTLVLAATGCKRKGESGASTGDFLALMNVGKSQFEKGDAAAAVSSFQAAVQMQPTSTDARLNLANALLASGQADQVLAQAEQVLGVDPLSAAAHYLAGCAYLRLGRFEEAVKSLQQSKDIDRTVNEVSFQLGVAYEGLKNLEDAIAQWRETIQFGPDHPAAYYRLSQALLRQGKTEEAEQMLERHRDVTAGKSIPSDLSFFERCQHTAMRVPFVLEQPERSGIEVQFTDATAEWLPTAAKYAGPVGLIDCQRTGQPGLLLVEDFARFRLLVFTNGHFEPFGSTVAAGSDGGYTKVLVGDLDNDRYEDAIVLGTNRSHVLKLGADGRITDRTLLTGLNELRAVDGRLADLDFTSKLSLVAALPEGQGIRFFRNLGNIMFKDDTTAIGLGEARVAATQVTVADWNKDDLPDVLAVDGGRVRIFANQRGGPLAETNGPALTGVSQIAEVSDFNNDLRPDAAIISGSALRVDLTGVTNRLAYEEPGAWGAGVLDYDNDGWLDFVRYGEGGFVVLRNVGERGFEPTFDARGTWRNGEIKSLLAADLDNDCDSDLVMVMADGGVRLFRNDGGSQNRMVKIKAVGNRSNASGIGTRFEFTAGNWRGMRTVQQTPLEVGLGRRNQIDSAFVQWTQLRMNLESIRAGECRVSFITEIEQKQMTSCPYLYAWDGQQFRFVSDFLAAAPVGLPVGPGRIIAADPEELLWIGGDAQFPTRDGKFLLQMTEELSEVLYLDQVELVVVDHPLDTEVYSTSKMLPSPPWLPHKIVTLGGRVALRRAFSNTSQDEFTRLKDGLPLVDVTERLQAVDEVRVSPEIYGDHLRGWAKQQEITLDFGPLDTEKPLALVLCGWLRFGGAMANMAAAQRGDLPFPFPVLEAELPDGTWRQVDVRVGTPAGRTKAILVDLEGKLPAQAQRLRLVYAFELHWDMIGLYEKQGENGTRISRLTPARAQLAYRGFSEDEKRGWTHPTTPVHDRLQRIPLVAKVPSGWSTRYGEIVELLNDRDDAFALINGGDAATIEFDAAVLPRKPDGYRRDFFVKSIGWEKDTDYHTLLGHQIEPWPWHGMDDQLYGTQARPALPSDALMQRYTTRWVGPHVPVRRDVARNN